LNHRKKIKAEPSRLIPWKLTQQVEAKMRNAGKGWLVNLPSNF